SAPPGARPRPAPSVPGAGGPVRGSNGPQRSLVAAAGPLQTRTRRPGNPAATSQLHPDGNGLLDTRPSPGAPTGTRSERPADSLGVPGPLPAHRGPPANQAAGAARPDKS